MDLTRDILRLAHLRGQLDQLLRAKNKGRETALDVARISGYREIVGLLESCEGGPSMSGIRAGLSCLDDPSRVSRYSLFVRNPPGADRGLGDRKAASKSGPKG